MYIFVNMATFGGFVIGPFFCMEMAALKTSFAGSHTHMHNFSVFAFSGRRYSRADEVRLAQ